MRLCHFEEEAGTPGIAAPVHCRGSDVMFGDGSGGAVPHHLLREAVLSDGGILLLEMARVFPHPGPEGHDGSM